MDNKRRGDVIQIDIDQCYGIIIDENGQDIRFLLSEMSGEVGINSKVIFEIELSRHGLVATNIVLAKELIKI